MTQTVCDPLYRHHRPPTEVIAHAVRRHLRFPLSQRTIEDLPATRKRKLLDKQKVGKKKMRQFGKVESRRRHSSRH